MCASTSSSARLSGLGEPDHGEVEVARRLLERFRMDLANVFEETGKQTLTKVLRDRSGGLLGVGPQNASAR
jgi:hypothetical protein